MYSISLFSQSVHISLFVNLYMSVLELICKQFIDDRKLLIIRIQKILYYLLIILKTILYNMHMVFAILGKIW
jgi:hypothetical protein